MKTESKSSPKAKRLPTQQHIHNLILAAQAVCQARDGSSPEATKIVLNKAIADLGVALSAF